MKVVSKDPRNEVVRLRAENLDDLWHLHNLIEVGDHVTASTYRTAEEIGDKIRSEKIAKERITLTLAVERIEFHEFSDRLRIMGIIVQGPRDLGAHHTFNVEAGDFEDLSLHKPKGYKAHHWDRIKEAVEAAQRPLVTILSMDDEEAVIAVLRQYGIQWAVTIKGRSPGKQYAAEDTTKDYFGETLAALKRIRTDNTPLVVVGPGFTREDFLKVVREREASFLKGVVTEGTGQAGRVGVQEALKRGIIERIQKDQQVAVDTRLVEEVMAEIARDGAVTYGPQQVEDALAMGAVEGLLMTDEVLRTRDGERLLETARRGNAKCHIVAINHEAGKKLQAIGGVAARLRFKINPIG
jgi:protein pelota